MSTTYKPVQCNICLEARESTLSLHDYDENEINWFTKLQFVIPELTQLRQHTLQNHLEDNDNKIKDIFTCYDCGLGFNTKTNLLCHIGNDHGESKLCLICERRCPDRTALENHIKYEHIIKENKECACTGCSENFESEIKLNEHLKGCHYYFQYCTIEENVNEDLKHNKNNEDQDYHQGSECKNYYAINELNLHNNLKHLQNKEQISIKKTKNRRGTQVC
ncbi:hypothetical protein NQ317_005452 [Molorchus minor]|uniref:C2H2-type domain-containing protein n=1 Tax=Molorchus minor TaxID=1323400 RepID=A0ABQ9IU13_9CUCU|nr:hypothetical protein NQ317_005452 [Molorchus minor]